MMVVRYDVAIRMMVCVWLGEDDDEAQGRGLDCGLKWRLSGVGGVKSMNGDEYR